MGLTPRSWRSRARSYATCACGVPVVAFIVHYIRRGNIISEDGAAEDTPVELLLRATEIPEHSRWVESWQGIYTESWFSDHHTIRGRLDSRFAPRLVNGRALFEKNDHQLLYFAPVAGYWHFGVDRDIDGEAAMIAARGASVASPELVPSYTWRTIGPQGKWHDAPELIVEQAPPRVLYLSGHAPAGWVKDFLGAYERQDALRNGFPAYRRRCGRRRAAGSSRCRGHERQWLYRTRNAEGELFWAIHAPEKEGAATSTMMKNTNDDLLHHRSVAVSGSVGIGDAAAPPLPLAPPAPVVTPWLIAAHAAGDDHGSSSTTDAVVEWMPAPHLLLTADRERARIGWYASRAEEALVEYPPLLRGLVVLLHQGMDVLDGALTEMLDDANDLYSSYLGGEEVEEDDDGILPGLLRLYALWYGQLRDWCIEHFVSIRAALNNLHPFGAAVLTTLFWSFVWSLRKFFEDDESGTSDDGTSTDNGNGNTDGEEDDTPNSSEEKRLAFACLSDAIEQIKPKVTEQEYLSLYSAAVWCFNLTPYWAGSVPQPPDDPPGVAPPPRVVRLALDVSESGGIVARASAVRSE